VTEAEPGDREGERSQEAGNRVVIITGAAKRLGAATARQMHRAGFNVAFSYHSSAAEAEQLTNELNTARAGSCRSYQVDVRDLAALKSFASQVVSDFGRVDALVNNASSFYPRRLQDTTPADFDDLFATNARAPFFLSQALSTELSARGGSIVNIVDIYAERPLPGYAAYCMAKAALAMLTQALARELGPAVRVNAIAPGNMLWSENPDKAETLATVLNNTALKRQGTPQDIAEAVELLLTRLPYVTGHTLKVDGGRSTNI
jgi:pteridine reductase